jgi:hypothetical protein
MPLGSETYGNPVIANGKVYVGTNNGNAYIKRYPSSVDLGVLVICLSEKDGKFLWQHSNEKLSTGRVHDWPNQGICASHRWSMAIGCGTSAVAEKLSAWTLKVFTMVRTMVLYVKTEKVQEKDEADVVWSLDMMKDLKVSQHNMCSCSVTCVGDLLFVNTG